MSNLFDPDPSCNGLAEGEARRDSALLLLAATRAELVRQLQMAAIRIGFEQNELTADDVRAVVPIPDGINAKVVGAALNQLSKFGFRSVGYRKSARPIAHARPLTIWRLVNQHDAMARLAELRSVTA